MTNDQKQGEVVKEAAREDSQKTVDEGKVATEVPADAGMESMRLSDIERKIMAETKAGDPTAQNIYISKVVSDFMESDVYYVAWDSSRYNNKDSFSYVLVTKDGILRTYEDGVSAMEKLKDILDGRRTFWQRLREFSLFEVMAALIALCVTGVFIFLSFYSSITDKNALSTEFMGIFGIIIGYYFGKNVPSSSK
jgi:hypothetical protein